MSVIDSVKGLSKDARIVLLRSELALANELNSQERKVCEMIQSRIDRLQAERDKLASTIETALVHVPDGPAHDLLAAVAEALKPPIETDTLH